MNQCFLIINGSSHRGGNGDILEACEYVTNMLLERVCYYPGKSAVYGVVNNDIKEQFNNCQYFNCATYVSSVLYYSGLLSENEINKYNYHSCTSLSTMLEANNWEKVSYDDMQPGDVLIHYNYEHVMVYAGDGKVWDQNTAVYSTDGDAPIKTAFNYAEHLSEYTNVWRAP